MGIKSAAGKCLGVANDNVNLQMKPCGSATALKYDSAGRLVSILTTQCVTVQNAGTISGSSVIMADCIQPAAQHQIWRKDDASYLRPKHAMWHGLCLDAGNASATVIRCQDAQQITGWAAGKHACC